MAAGQTAEYAGAKHRFGRPGNAQGGALMKPDINLCFIETFVVIERLKSFAAAAAELHVSQPAISGRIAKLEEQIGVALFERRSPPVTLTAQGNALLPLAKEMVHLRDQMAEIVGEPRVLRGKLLLGVMETVVHTWLPELLARFSVQHPEVSIELSSDITPTLRDQLLNRRLDCTLLSEEINEGVIDNRRLMTMNVGWVAAPTLSVPQPATFSDVAKQAFISFYPQSSMYGNLVKLGEGRRPPRISYFSSLKAMVSLAKIGYGIAPLPLAVIDDELARGELRVLDLQPAPSPLPIVGSMRNDAPSPAAKALLELAAEVCDEYVRRRAV
jgi:DNA-binding transcriptional LysR family regulator